MKAVSFESLFMSNKTWLSRMIWSCLLLISIGFMSYLFYINDNDNEYVNNHDDHGW